MSTRYLKRSRHHALYASISGLLVVMTTTACIVNALAERPAWAIAAACGTALFLFIATLETCESLRCLKIAARWNVWDRRDLPPQDEFFPRL